MKKRISVISSLCLCSLGLTACTSNMEIEMEHAALNTLLGMGMAFSVLILISLIISLFAFIPKLKGNAAKKNAEAQKNISTKEAIDNTIDQITEQEELSDDAELVAAVSAAIAAYEGTSSAGGFQVRSIRRVGRNNWKKG